MRLANRIQIAHSRWPAGIQGAAFIALMFTSEAALATVHRNGSAVRAACTPDLCGMATKTTTARDRTATEHRLLEAAGAVFAQKGYDGASVLDVANAAETNVALINRYFGSKAGLLDAVLERFLSTVRNGQLDYPPQPTLAEEVYHYLLYRLRADRRHGHLVRLAVSRLATHHAEHPEARLILGLRIDANFEARLERLRGHGGTAASTDEGKFFAAVAYFSFAANFFGDLLGSRSEDELEDLFRDFADRITRAKASGEPIAPELPKSA